MSLHTHTYTYSHTYTYERAATLLTVFSLGVLAFYLLVLLSISGNLALFNIHEIPFVLIAAIAAAGAVVSWGNIHVPKGRMLCVFGFSLYATDLLFDLVLSAFVAVRNVTAVEWWYLFSASLGTVSFVFIGLGYVAVMSAYHRAPLRA